MEFQPLPNPECQGSVPPHQRGVEDRSHCACYASNYKWLFQAGILDKFPQLVLGECRTWRRWGLTRSGSRDHHSTVGNSLYFLDASWFHATCCRSKVVGRGLGEEKSCPVCLFGFCQFDIKHHLRPLEVISASGSDLPLNFWSAQM